MTKEYYIRITDTKPSDIEDGVYFKYEGNGDDEQFYLLSENEYVELKEEFEDIKGNFQRTVDPYVADALSRMNVNSSNNSFAIMDEADNTKRMTYAELMEILAGHKAKLDEIDESIIVVNQDLDKTNQSVESITRALEVLDTETDTQYDKLILVGNEYYVHAILYWSNAQAKYYPFGTYDSEGNARFVVHHIIPDSIPSDYRPSRSFGIMNGTTDSNSAGLKIVFRYDGSIDIVNVSNVYVNRKANSSATPYVRTGDPRANKGYDIICTAMWMKKSALNDILTVEQRALLDGN